MKSPLEAFSRCLERHPTITSTIPADAIELLPLLLQLPQSGAPGTFIEIGANDGVTGSNTLLLESCFGWRGLLIEAAPPTFARLKRSGRTTTMLHSATCAQRGSVNFTTTDGFWSAFNMAVDQVDEQYLARWKKHADPRRAVAVPCAPLGELMDREQLERVNFLSLDTQGSEAHVLATVDPARFDIVLVELESNSGQRNIRGVREMLNASRMVQLPLAARSKGGHNELWVRHDASWLRDVRPTHHASHATNLSVRANDRMVPFPALAEISDVALLG